MGFQRWRREAGVNLVQVNCRVDSGDGRALSRCARRSQQAVSALRVTIPIARKRGSVCSLVARTSGRAGASWMATRGRQGRARALPAMPHEPSQVARRHPRPVMAGSRGCVPCRCARRHAARAAIALRQRRRLLAVAAPHYARPRRDQLAGTPALTRDRRPRQRGLRRRAPCKDGQSTASAGAGSSAVRRTCVRHGPRKRLRSCFHAGADRVVSSGIEADRAPSDDALGGLPD